MKSLLFILFLFFIFCTAAFAQTNEISPCPTVNISGPAGDVLAGETMTFTVGVGENYSDTAKYEWSVSAGVIIEGQGSPVIRVATTPDLAGTEIIASVKVRNLPENCANKFSERAVVAEISGDPFELDNYGKISFQDEKVRLFYIAKQLKSEPTSAALFIIKFSKRETTASVKARVARISKLLTESFGISKEKLIFVYAEGEDQSTRIYLVPPGAIDSFPSGENSLEKLRPGG